MRRAPGGPCVWRESRLQCTGCGSAPGRRLALARRPPGAAWRWHADLRARGPGTTELASASGCERVDLARRPPGAGARDYGVGFAFPVTPWRGFCRPLSRAARCVYARAVSGYTRRRFLALAGGAASAAAVFAAGCGAGEPERAA